MSGIQVLVEGLNPIVDIVAVHGLDGDSMKLWTHSDNGAEICWLKDPEFLPHEIPKARILVFGYDAKTTAERTSSATLTDHADTLIGDLGLVRRETQTQDRPIIFIAHSLGGIVVKQALVRSRLSSHPQTSEFYASTKAVLFFGTPHLGTPFSDIHAIVLRITRLFVAATDHIAKKLAQNSEYLQGLQSEFALFRQDMDVIYFYEEYATSTPAGIVLLVPRESAVPDNQRNAVKLRKDHVDMVKYTSSSDDDFKKVISHLKECISALRDISPELTMEQQQQLARKKEQISAWLKAPVASSYRHQDARKRHRDGTGDWFLGTDMFQRWSSSSNSFFWTYGKSGSGKTVWISTIIEHLMQIARSNARCAVAYHYCSFQDSPQALCGDVVASLVDQLQRQASSISECLLKLHTARDRDTPASRSVERLMEPLQELSSSFKDTYVLIDALDEFDANRIDDLMILLSSIKKWALPSVHVLLTSQYHHLSIREPLVELTHTNDRLDLVADESTRSDIRHHIQSTLSESPKFSRRWAGNQNDVLDEIETALIEKSDGSFRWVACQIRALSECRTFKDLRTALSSLPHDLNETYSRILGGLTSSDRALAWKILIWLVFAERRLTIGELATILSEDEQHYFDVDNELSSVDVVQLCRDLTSLEREKGTLANSEVTSQDYLILAHSSVRDWLTEPGSELKPSIADQSWGHAMLATTTLSYVLSKALPNLDYRPSFWQYSVDECMNHASQGATDHVQQLVLDLFDERRGIYGVWNESRKYALVSEYEKYPNIDWDARTPLYHASRYGLHWAIESLINRGVNVNGNGRCGKPLRAAASFGHSKICEALLAAGADVNGADDFLERALRSTWDFYKQLHPISSPHGDNALEAAAAAGHTQTVEVLLIAGVDVNAVGGRHDTALTAAVDGGHTQIVEVLLAAGADPNACRNGALVAAAAAGRKQIVEVLLAAGADINAGGFFGNGLSVAAAGGHTQIVEMLLAAGADVNVVSQHCALVAAANKGRTQIVKMLLAAGAGVNTAGGYHGSALAAAADMGHTETVHALLAAGADVNAAGGDYDGALVAAAHKGRIQIVQLLLEAGADVNAAGGRNGSAIQAAAYGGNIEIVEKLLMAGADVNIRGWESTVLHSVIEGGKGFIYGYSRNLEIGEKLTQILINAGANVNLLDSKGRSPLFSALRFEASSAVKASVAPWPKMVDLLTAAGALEIGEESGDEKSDGEVVDSDEDTSRDSSSESEWHSCAESA